VGDDRMDAVTALSYMVLGAFLGMMGQGIRFAIGMKKRYEENTGKKSKEWFDSARMILSFIIGAAAGVLASIYLLGADVDRYYLLTVMAAGYAGADFIEALLRKYKPINLSS